CSTACTCSRVRPSNVSSSSSMVMPASRFSKTVATGNRVPRNTQAPLLLPGTLSTAGHWDQSSAAMTGAPFHYPSPNAAESQGRSGKRRQRTRFPELLYRLVDALDAKDAGSALDGGEDAVELAAVLDFQVHFDARAQIVLVRFERTDIGAGLADGAGDFREHAGPIFGEHQEAGDELAFGGAGPFHVNAALGFVEQVLDVGTIAI